jgi:hypothetical protein
LRVIGDDGRGRIVRWPAAREVPCLGHDAPISVRAPCHGPSADPHLAPRARLVRQGAEAEYLAGTGRVVLRAGDPVPGRGAARDRCAAETA